MHTTPMKLLTIVAETVLVDHLTQQLLLLGATGWTMTDARGDGSRGVRTGPRPGENIRLESVLAATAADKALSLLAREYFPHYALVAWVQEVQVVRGEKYV